VGYSTAVVCGERKRKRNRELRLEKVEVRVHGRGANPGARVSFWLWAIAVVIAVVIAIPVVVVIETAVVAIPISGVVAAAFMARADPARAAVGRSGPIAVVPAISMAVGIPVAVDPEKLRAGLNGTYADDPRRRRCSEFNANGDLRP